jgi:hypothetical protein
MNGHNGRILQAYASIGDRLSKTSLMDSTLTYAADFMNGVPKDFRGSTSWWKAAAQHKNR